MHTKYETRVNVFFFFCSFFFLSFLVCILAVGLMCSLASSTAVPNVIDTFFLSEQRLPPKRSTSGIPKYLNMYAA